MPENKYIEKSFYAKKLTSKKLTWTIYTSFAPLRSTRSFSGFCKFYQKLILSIVNYQLALRLRFSEIFMNELHLLC